MQIGDGSIGDIDKSYHDFKEDGIGGEELSGNDDAELGRALCAWQLNVDAVPVERKVSGKVEVIGTLDICIGSSDVANTRIGGVRS